MRTDDTRRGHPSILGGIILSIIGSFCGLVITTTIGDATDTDHLIGVLLGAAVPAFIQQAGRHQGARAAVGILLTGFIVTYSSTAAYAITTESDPPLPLPPPLSHPKKDPKPPIRADRTTLHCTATGPCGQITIENVGSKPAPMRRFELTGNGARSFSHDHACESQTLDPGQTCTIPVAYTLTTPAAPGQTQEAELVIHYNLPGDAVRVALTGDGDGDGGTPPPPTTAPLTASPLSPHCTTAGSCDDITVKNVGSKPTLLGPFKFEGSDADSFSRSPGCDDQTPLNPGQTCTIPVTYTPKTPATPGQTQEATLVIHYDLPGDAVRVTFTGDGAGGGGGNGGGSGGGGGGGGGGDGGSPPVPVNPQSLPCTSAGHCGDITITNNRSEPMRLGPFEVLGDGAASFSHDHTCENQTLDPGQTCTIPVTYTPKTPTTPGQTQEATLVIHYDLPGAPVRVALTGQA